MIDKDAVVEILKERLSGTPCLTCDNMKNNIPVCHECNPRWVISEEYAREIANEIARKGEKE